MPLRFPLASGSWRRTHRTDPSGMSQDVLPGRRSRSVRGSVPGFPLLRSMRASRTVVRAARHRRVWSSGSPSLSWNAALNLNLRDLRSRPVKRERGRASGPRSQSRSRMVCPSRIASMGLFTLARESS